jgi:hypothetical protein
MWLFSIYTNKQEEWKPAMRKRSLYTIFALLSLTSTLTQAALFDRGNGMIYDDVLDITWLQDANYAKTSGYDADGAMNRAEAIAWADQLTYGGFSDWRLPTTIDGTVREPLVGALRNGEMAHLYYEDLGLTGGDSILSSTDPDLGLFTNIESARYWESGSYVTNSGKTLDGTGWVFQTYDGMTFTTSTVWASEYYAWAVRSGDVSPVPLPVTVWLFGSGLLGLVGFAKSRKAWG